jgi:hypothetical protein
MNFPSYKPNPPSLLRNLTGRGKKAGDVDLIEATDAAEILDSELDFSTEDLAFADKEASGTEAGEHLIDDTYSFDVPVEEGLEEEGQESEQHIRILGIGKRYRRG